MTLTWRDGEFCNTSNQSAPQSKDTRLKVQAVGPFPSIFSLFPSKEAEEIGKQKQHRILLFCLSWRMFVLVN